MNAEKERLEKIRAYYKNDRYAVEATGLRIADAAPGSSVIELTVDERHQNAKGGVMGGVLMTMADFASTVADFAEGEQNVTVSSGMEFLSTPKDARLRATATAEKRGRTMGFYRIEITDGTGRPVAVGHYTLMHLPA